MSPTRRHRQPLPEADRELRRTVIVATAQCLIREALVVILREIWRGGPW
jgi:hypothetical protein